MTRCRCAKGVSGSNSVGKVVREHKTGLRLENCPRELHDKAADGCDSAMLLEILTFARKHSSSKSIFSAECHCCLHRPGPIINEGSA